MMKRMMRPLTTAALLALAGTAAMAAERQLEVRVSGMYCASCPLIVRSSMQSVPSVKVQEFVAGPQDGEGVFVVTYDDETADPAAIVKAVEANGYEAALASGADNS